MDSALFILAIIFLLFSFQMAVLNFNRILLMLADQGSIPWDTLQSQDGPNLGDVHFCSIRQTLRMQCISLDRLRELIAKGAFMPPTSEGPPELSGTTAILLVFQADGQHERITDVYVGLVIHRVESCLYTPDQILDFVTDIEVNLKVAWDALKAGGDPGNRRAFCLFVSNYGGAMSIPTDLPYCLIYPMSYVRDVEPDHFDTRNNPAGTRLHHCICRATLQYMNDDPSQCREYSGSRLILPRGAQYKEQLFPEILKPRNHWEQLTNSATKEPFPTELVGDFRSKDPIFKGCCGNSFLYSNAELGRLRRHGIHLAPYRGEIPTPLAPSYLQARQPKATKWSPPRAVTPNPSVESPKTKCSGSKGRPQRSSNTSVPKCPNSTSAKKPSSSKEPTLNKQEKSPRARSSHKHSHSPSPSTKSVGCKRKEVHTEGSHALNSTLPVSSNMFESLHSPTGSHSNVTELLPPSHHLNPLGSCWS